MKAPGTQFLPDLLNRIHLRRVRRNEHEFNVGKDFQRPGFVPRSTVANKDNVVIGIGRRQMIQKEIHAYRVAVGHDQKAGVSCQGFYRSIHIPVFPNMVAGNGWADTFSAPAILWLVNTAEACFILKHQTNRFFVVENFLQFCDSSVNFFEASTASGSALFGCLLLGIFFVHPCRCST